MKKIKCLLFTIGLAVGVLLLVDSYGNRRVFSSKDRARELAKHVTPFRLVSKGNAIYGSGSHIRWKGKSYILTNRHICEAAIQYNKNKKVVQVDDQQAEIVKIGVMHDLCVLKSKRKEGLEISLFAAKPLDKITLIGFPRGVGKVIREGRIIGDTVIRMVGRVGKLVYLRLMHSTQISATAYPGNSGSPVLNNKGLVIGVLFAGSPSYPHEPFIVPHKYLLDFLKDLGKKKEKKIEKVKKKQINKITLDKLLKDGKVALPL